MEQGKVLRSPGKGAHMALEVMRPEVKRGRLSTPLGPGDTLARSL